MTLKTVSYGESEEFKILFLFAWMRTFLPFLPSPFPSFLPVFIPFFLLPQTPFFSFFSFLIWTFKVKTALTECSYVHILILQYHAEIPGCISGYGIHLAISFINESTIAEDAPWLKTNYTKKWIIGMKRQSYVLGLKSYASSANYCQ